jgi:hypothetical protein
MGAMDIDDMNEGMIMRKDGQIMTVQNGELKLLEEEAEMPDGTRIQTDGTVVLADGTTRKLAEGETLRRVEHTAGNGEMPTRGPADEMTGTESRDPT